MGNYHETSLFIRDGIGDKVCQDITKKRKDVIYIKTTGAIIITGIGLCSGIGGRPSAFLNIYDTNCWKKVHSDNIELISGDQPISYYDLKTPVKIKEEEYYMIQVEVFGAATYTYTDTSEYSTHRDLVIELCREVPFPTFGGGDHSPAASQRSLSSVWSVSRSKTQLDKVKSPKNEALKFFHSDVTNLESGLQRRRSIMSTDSLPVGSARESVQSHRRKPEAVSMNMISGIVFTRPSRGTCCGPK